MWGSIFGAVVLGQGAPIELDTPIARATVYKNGAVMAVREGSLEEGDHLYELKSIPLAYEGSFWPQPAEGVEIGDVRSSLEMIPTKMKIPAKSVRQLIEFNLGRTLTIVKTLLDGNEKRVTGKALGLEGDILTLDSGDGVIRSIEIEKETGVAAQGLKMEVEVTRVQPRIRVSFRARSKRAGQKLKFLTMEGGAAWANHYLLDLNSDQGRLTEKATLGLGGLNLDNAEVDLVSGSLQANAGKGYDFSLGGASLDSYLRGQGTSMLPRGEGDPYVLLADILAREGQSYEGNAGSAWASRLGSLANGGLEGLVPEGAGTVTFDPATTSFVVQGTDEAIRQLEGAVQIEDAYTIAMGRLTLKPGERLTRLVFEDAQTIDRVFASSIRLDRAQEGTVFSRALLANRSGSAWTAGPLLVVSKAVPQAVVTMPFTAPGGLADLDLGEAKDIEVNVESHVTGRQALGKDAKAVVAYRNTIETRITILNRRTLSAHVKVEGSCRGTMLDAGGGIVELEPSGEEPEMKVEWT